MRFKIVFFAFTFFFLGSGIHSSAQVDFYNLAKVQKIELQFSQANWDYILDTNKYGGDNYILASSVTINGIRYDSVGVKYKGSSSYDSTYKKNPLHIKLDKFKSYAYQGLTDIKLANCYSDPSMIREVLSYNILNKYMHCPRANFAMLFINGVYYGLFSNDEPITKNFCSEHFMSDINNTMFKCSQAIASPYAKSSLIYITKDSFDYFPRYEIESKTGWNDLMALCDSVTNSQLRIPALVDVDRFLWMFAFNNILVNMDSYCGAFSQNYYIYRDDNKQYVPIAWDLNMSFGAFPYVGSQGGGLGTLTVTQMQNLSAMLHANDADWPLMKYLLSDPGYKKRYLAHVKTLLNENFINGNYETMAAQMQATIDSAVKADNFKFFTYAQFQNGMTGNVVFGSRTIPGLKNLMDIRKNTLLTNDLTGTQPVISNVATSVLHPVLNSTFTFKASIAGAINVYAYYRFNQAARFVRVPMYDDGLHNDGAANDNVFGASIQMSYSSCQYYVYAESADAAMLSPQRAEYEFYTVTITNSKVNKGDVAINEFMASNVAAVKDTAGEYDDWVELYNNTATAVDMSGWFLTDDFGTRTKWKFPNGTGLPAFGYLIVWCDNQTTQAGYHSNFKLSGSGEQIMLSQADSSIVDSITFGAQRTDTSYARIPNGKGPFQFRLNTFNHRNDTSGVGIKDNNTLSTLIIYPNPGKGCFYIETKDAISITVFTAAGKELLQTQSKVIDLSNQPMGIYLFKITLPNNRQIYRKVEVMR